MNVLCASRRIRDKRTLSLADGSNVTVHILPGLYRESVVVNASGASFAPFVFTAEHGLGSVRLYDSVPAASLTWSVLGNASLFAFLPPAETCRVFVTSLAGSPAPTRGLFQTASGSFRRLPPCRTPN